MAEKCRKLKEEQTTSQKTGKTCEAVSEGNFVFTINIISINGT